MATMIDSTRGAASAGAEMDEARVLIVEGYGHSREGLTASLRAGGLMGETAAEYLEAIRKMQDGHFTVAIIDVDLVASRNGELTGWDLARIFRALHPGAAVFLVTAEWRRELQAEADRLPDCTLIEKPINPAELRGMLRSLQGKRSDLRSDLDEVISMSNGRRPEH
jgi:DNA-binding NtrC family response regulator